MKNNLMKNNKTEVYLNLFLKSLIYDKIKTEEINKSELSGM
jgi:hypothetical protein